MLLRRCLTGVLLLMLVSCASTGPSSRDLVMRAVEAVGGAAALAEVRTLRMTVQMRQWEPEQSYVPGGEMKFAADSWYDQQADFVNGRARIDWRRDVVYPTKRHFEFSEIVNRDAGYVAGIDSSNRNRQSLQAKPPGHAMTSMRLAATQRELERGSPRLLLDMYNNPDAVSSAGDVQVRGQNMPAVHYRADDRIYTVVFDPMTALPERIRTIDYDNINGDVAFDLVLSDWVPFGNVRLPMRREYQFNGRTLVEMTAIGVELNPAFSADHFEIPAGVRATAAPSARGNIHYQWTLRRQFIGNYIDSENTAYDARAGIQLRFTELAPGVQHQAAGSAHSLIVEMQDHLIVFDAPTTDWQSNWTIKAAAEKYPGKPVRYLVLTHHHMDHAGGMRAYAAAGATLVVGPGNGPHFRKLLAAPATLNPDLPGRDLSGTPVIEVKEKHVISDGRRDVMVIPVENTHAQGMVIGYVADARIGFVTDLWAPGRDVIGEKLNATQQAVVTAVTKAGIQPLRFAGGHGSTADYAPLAARAQR